MIYRISDFDPVEDRYMAILVNDRSDVKVKEANATVQNNDNIMVKNK